MQEKYKLHYSTEFIEKAKQIQYYINYELQNPIASYHFQIKISQAFSILEYFPQARPIYKNTSYRYLIMQHWLIFYEINDGEVEISKIFSSKQNFNSQNLF